MHYKTSWGETVVGLCRRANGRYYPVGRNDRSCGSDEKLVIHVFRRWQQEQGIDAELFDPYEFDSHGGNLVRYERERIRTLILNDPVQASIDLSIPHWAQYPAAPEEPQFSLDELCQTYFSKTRNKRENPLA